MLKINFIWILFIKCTDFTLSALEYFKRILFNTKSSIIIDNLCPNLNIMNGPFKGMKYPTKKAAGSALYPKLLGCYEIELHQLIENISKIPYTEIVDIGCAEGYYAVGLAMRIPTATVFAFDIDEEAIRLCKSMAMFNNVDNRIITSKYCNSNTLTNLPLTKKALFICDCEGCEKELFGQEVVRFLLEHDVIIEIHDGVDPSISSYIRQLFKKSHNIDSLKILSNAEKTKIFNYAYLENYNHELINFIINEGRENSTEWLFLESKSIAINSYQKT